MATINLIKLNVFWFIFYSFKKQVTVACACSYSSLFIDRISSSINTSSLGLWWRQPVRHAESLTIDTNLSTCAHIRMHAQPHTHTHILSVWFRTTWRVLAFINMYSVKKHGVWKVTTRSEKSDAEVERLVGGTAEKGWREVKRRREKMWLLKNQAVTVETAR